MLKIEPIMDDGLNSCYHFLIASVANWYDCGFELMYMDAWGFRFAPEGTKGPGIWERGDLGPRIFYGDVAKPNHLLERFHGLNVRDIYNNNHNETYNLIIKVLQSNQPIIISMDTFYLPWLDKFYQKIHSTHVVLVVGMDESGNLLCNDTRPFFQPPVSGGLLLKESFMKGYMNAYSVINRVVIHNNTLSNCMSIVKQTAVKMIDELDSPTCGIKAMIEFGKHIEQHSISLIDLENFDGGNGILIRGIRNIIRDRINFFNSIKYIDNTFGVNHYIQLSERFNKCIEDWTILKSVLYKSYLNGDIDSHRNKFASIIYENAILEEDIANRILGLD